MEIGCGNLDRACIYVSVCIDAPRHGQHYCTLHLFILSRVTIPDMVAGVLVELFLICNIYFVCVIGPTRAAVSP